MLVSTTPLTVQSSPVHALVYAGNECYYIHDASKMRIEDGLINLRNSVKRKCTYVGLTHNFFGEKIDHLIRIPICAINFRIHEGIEKPEWVDTTKEQIMQEKRNEMKQIEEESKKCVDAMSELNSNLTKEEEAARLRSSLKQPFLKRLVNFLGF